MTSFLTRDHVCLLGGLTYIFLCRLASVLGLRRFTRAQLGLGTRQGS
jgi:hypothetical protein